jgi:hypothetical protein
MIWVPRPLYALAALGLLVLAALAWPGLFAALGLDVRIASEDAAFLDREIERSDQLDAGLEEAMRRNVARRRLIRDLAAGRLSVPEAAQKFWEIRVAPAWFLRDCLLREERGDSDEERLCRHVIRWIWEELQDRPEEAERAVALREAELAKHLAQHGRVILPGGKLSLRDDGSNR